MSMRRLVRTSNISVINRRLAVFDSWLVLLSEQNRTEPCEKESRAGEMNWTGRSISTGREFSCKAQREPRRWQNWPTASSLHHGPRQLQLLVRRTMALLSLSVELLIDELTDAD